MPDPKQRRIMRKFRITELSAVDKPAQEGAEVAIMKRATAQEDEQMRIAKKKGMPVPKADEAKKDFVARACDHPMMKDEYPALKDRRSAASDMHDAHLADLAEDAGTEAEESGEQEELPAGGAEKRAPYWKAEFSAEQRQNLAESGAAMSDGSFPIRNKSDLENALHAQGRAKDVDAARRHIKARAKELGLESMLPDSFGGTKKSANQGDEMELQELTKRVASLEAELAEAQKVAKMSDAEKAAAQDATNPVVFKSADGTSFRKNDDPRLVAQAQRIDALAKSSTEANEKAAMADFAKRAATELTHLPGDVVAKAALLRAVSGISDEAARKGVETLLRAHDSGMAAAFKRSGTSQVPTTGVTPAAQLDTLAKNLVETKKIPYGKAYEEILKSAEGKALYEQTTVGVGNGI